MQATKNASPVFVAGLGVISAIGNGVAACLSSLENYQAGMGSITYLNTLLTDPPPVAEVKMSDKELEALSGLRPGTTRTALFSMLAARESLADAGIQISPSLRVGFISANTVGGMDKTEGFFSDFLRDHKKGKLRNIISHECGKVTELVGDALGINSYTTTISTACSSSANAIVFAARLIRQGLLDVAIAGGTDALTKFTLNGFNALMILDREYCRPFADNRSGLNLGEGAGYLALVSEKMASTLAKKPYCTLAGYCNKNDAYHQTASSPEGTGCYLAMRGALGSSGLPPAGIDYINLHGTGTQNNDFAEGFAIQRLFEPAYPPMSSTKSFTGHTLGASGGIEAVFSVLALARGIVYPNLRLKIPMHEFPFSAETRFLTNRPIKNVMSNSFGFGGNCTSLIFSKISP